MVLPSYMQPEILAWVEHLIFPQYTHKMWHGLHFLLDIYGGQKEFLDEPSHCDEHAELHDLHLDRCSKHQIPA